MLDSLAAAGTYYLTYLPDAEDLTVEPQGDGLHLGQCDQTWLASLVTTEHEHRVDFLGLGTQYEVSEVFV